MISKTLDTMISKMEHSTDEDQAVAASCLRIDVERWAEDHACYRCEKAVWMAGPALQPTPKTGQPVTKVEFKWGTKLGACGAFLPVLKDEHNKVDHFPDAPFFCSAQEAAGSAGGFALAAEERQGSSGAGWGEVQTPRQRGQGEGE